MSTSADGQLINKRLFSLKYQCKKCGRALNDKIKLNIESRGIREDFSFLKSRCLLIFVEIPLDLW